jgi:hypothetical protein
MFGQSAPDPEPLVVTIEWLRHSRITSHCAQMALACCWRRRKDFPRSPSTGKKIAGSSSRRCARNCQDHNASEGINDDQGRITSPILGLQYVVHRSWPALVDPAPAAMELRWVAANYLGADSGSRASACLGVSGGWGGGVGAQVAVLTQRVPELVGDSSSGGVDVACLLFEGGGAEHDAGHGGMS